MKIYLKILFLSAALMFVGACVPAPDPTLVQASRNEAMVLLMEAQQQVTELRTKQQVDGLTPEEAGALAKAEATIGDLRNAVNQIPDNGDANWFDAGAAVSTVLPPPWNIGAGIGLGALGEWWRGRKKRRSFDVLVETIEKVKGENPKMAEAFKESSTEINASLPSATKELIAKKRHKLNGKS